MRTDIQCLSPAVLLAAWFAVGCATEDSQGPRTKLESATLSVQAGDSQIGAPGALVPIRPAIRVQDEHGNPIHGVAVSFALVSGGGTVTGTDALSDTMGVATVGSWTLGPVPGTNTMSATVVGSADTVLFTATALCDCWKPQASLNVARINAGAAVVNGKLYIVAGQNYTDLSLPIEEYDPATNSWTARAMMPAYDKIGIAALDGRIYAVGTDWDGVTPWLKSYDPATDRWTQHAAPPTARQHIEAVAIGGLLYAVGGSGNRGLLNILERYDPATDTWLTLAPMITGRDFAAVAVANGILYVMGGEGNGGEGEGLQALSSVESYDPATNKWTSRAPLPVPLYGAAAAVLDGIIYVGGGGPIANDGKPYVYAYDPAKDSWTVQPPMRIGRSNAMAAALDGVLYEIGGWDRGTGPLASVEGYRP